VIVPNTAAAGAALAQAYQRDPDCRPTLLHIFAQTGFVVRDWSLGDSAPVLANVREALEALAGR